MIQIIQMIRIYQNNKKLYNLEIYFNIYILYIYIIKMDIQVIGTQYKKGDTLGDFKKMVIEKKYDNCLFIFNDNLGHHKTNVSGAGNGEMRIYNKYSKYNPPRSAGISTGPGGGGYTNLTPDIIKEIDGEIDEIIELIVKYDYKTVQYSIEIDKNLEEKKVSFGTLGDNIFTVGKDVKEYITMCIQGLSTKPVKFNSEP